MRTVQVLLSLMFLFGCGIFELRDAEYPDGGNMEDPFNLNQILQGTGEQFRTRIYEDIFADDFTFESDVFSARYTKDEIVEALEHLRQGISEVVWTQGTVFNDGSQITLTGTVYKVYYKGELKYSGRADFRLIKGLEWKIRYWKDYPDDENRPFFML